MNPPSSSYLPSPYSPTHSACSFSIFPRYNRNGAYAIVPCRLHPWEGCACADRPTPCSTFPWWRPSGHPCSWPSTGCGPPAGRATRMRTDRSGRCTWGYSSAETSHHPCTSSSLPRSALAIELRENRRTQIYRLMDVNTRMRTGLDSNTQADKSTDIDSIIQAYADVRREMSVLIKGFISFVTWPC